MAQLQDRVAVVTGGASGIGRATALLLAREGARVFAADLRPQPANRELFASLGIQERTCDVRDEPQVRALLDEAAGPSGRLDILVSNAGFDLPKALTDVSIEEWDTCLDTNLKGCFLTSKHAIRWMRDKGGAVVFTASNAGLLPRAHDPVYSTSKAAVVALAKALALAYAPDRIRFTSVCPGPVSNTGIMDVALAAAADRGAAERAVIDASPMAAALGRMVTPEEVAQAILYLVSDAAMFVTGTALRIDGGKSLGVPSRR
ncbi:MAG: SDR family NAD(P)-dependent oxidoreductase [Pirellulales bacterium]